MKICHYDFSKPLELEDGVGILVAENATKFVEYCNDFVAQQNGDDGSFIVDDGEKTFSFKKSGCIVFDFFSASLNDKKIVAGIYDKIGLMVDEKYLQEYYDLLGRMSSFCDLLALESPLAVEYNADVCVQDFLKTMKVCPIDDNATFIEKVVDWLDAKAQFCNIKLFVLVNFRTFLGDEDCKLAIEHFGYAPYSVLFLERTQPARLKNEPMRIIDNDLCEIVVE